jgi:hypothetical protein
MLSDEFKKQFAAESEKFGQIVDRAQRVEGEPRPLVINKQDALMIINDFDLTVEDFEHYHDAHKFIQFQINTNATAYLDLQCGLLFLWSGLGEYYDYAAEFSVKTPERLAEILKVLAV